MMWDILMWLALVLLVAVMVVRLVASRSQAGKMGSKGAGRRDNPLTQGRALPIAAGIVLLIALGMKFGPGIINPLPEWSDEERIEVEQFGEALSLYAQATVARDQADITREDWESIRAILEAAGSEMSAVSDQVLRKIHPDLPSHVAKNFIPGTRLGSYGLLRFIEGPAKGRDAKTDKVYAASRDSLARGRQLLEDWTTWFKTQGEEIIERIQ